MNSTAAYLFSQFPAQTPAWVVVTAIVLFACVFAWAVHAAVHAIACHFMARRGGAGHSIVKRTGGIARYALIVLAVSALLPLAPLSKEARGGARRGRRAAVI